MSLLGKSSVDVSKLGPSEYKAQKKAATELYSAFVHEAMKELYHHRTVVPEAFSTEVILDE